MESEKITELIAQTRIDPVLAREVLQSQNWDVRAALQLCNVLRGSSPVHHGLTPPNNSSSYSTQRNSTTNNKPAIAPKPVFIGSRLKSSPVPVPPPRSQKLVTYTSVMFGNESPPRTNNSSTPPICTSSTLLSPLPKIATVLSVSGSSGVVGVDSCKDIILPPLVTNCNTVTDNKASTLITVTSPSSERYSSSHLKNTILMEKVLGNSSNQHNPLHKQKDNNLHEMAECFIPKSKSNPLSSNVSVHNSCIISVNSLNNNTSSNNNESNMCKLSCTPKPTISGTFSPSASLPSCNHWESPPSPTSSSSLSSPTGVCEVPRSEGIHVDISCNLPSPSPSTSKLQPSTREQKESSTALNHKETQILEGVHWKRPEEIECKVDVTDQVLPPEVIHLTSSGAVVGPSLSAPCSPAKPLLRKTEAVDLEEYDYFKKLSRGISKATDNVNLVSKARTEFAQEIWEALDASKTPFFIETPVFTFTLPDLTLYSHEFRAFLERDLVETSTLVSLEGAGKLNWWALTGASQRLWPLATTGDGNCLLHAASLGMWGFHDRLLTLRKALHEFLTKSQYSRPLWRRWRWQLSQQNQETGLVYSQEEWEAEWANVLRLASSAPRGGSGSANSDNNNASDKLSHTKRLSNGFMGGQSDECTGHVYESLEEIHVLALAHVLRRPIIVVADTTLKDVSGEPLAPIPFGGVYLPLECPPQKCHRSPLLLTYDAAHFSALVVMETQSDVNMPQPPVIPVTDCSHDLLPIQFVIDPGDEFVWGQDEHNPIVIEKLTITNHDKIGLLNEYLDIIQVPIPPGYLEVAASCQAMEDAESPENGHPDIEKKSSESSFDSDEGPPYTDGTGALFPSKSKATKQLQTVAKQFGSIGKSMSKRIKKNFGTLSKLGRTGSFRKKDEYVKTCSLQKTDKLVQISTNQNFILAAEIHTEKRHAYQEEMVRNYLNTARLRFEKKSEFKRKQEEELRKLEQEQQGQQTDIDGPVQCINPGCSMYGTALTAYMCSACFAKQKEEEHEYKRQAGSNINSPKLARVIDGPHYGAGKSCFYAELDQDSLLSASKIPLSRPLSSQKDGTLFLSNSTFYSDTSSIPSYNLSKSQTTPNKPLSTSVTVSKANGDVTNKSSHVPLVVKTKGVEAVPYPVVTSSLTTKPLGNVTPIAIDDVKVSMSVESCQESLHCLTPGCLFYGSVLTSGFCSKCHQETTCLGVQARNVLVKSTHL
ncbi:uncharacterized protein LOC143025466 isoform X2 [Oratosquilla oratoria]|uniref:uncharacterized protein LOC143025466 isoform X2 n=1 Tax=Oratosquilla oratoria TaxID=337810 RepID=UPI003F757622